MALLIVIIAIVVAIEPTVDLAIAVGVYVSFAFVVCVVLVGSFLIVRDENECCSTAIQCCRATRRVVPRMPQRLPPTKFRSHCWVSKLISLNLRWPEGPDSPNAIYSLCRPVIPSRIKVSPEK